MRTFLILPLLAIAPVAVAQNVGINSTGAAPAASAMLDVSSTNSGLLIPRVGLGAANLAAPVVVPATSLLVYNTATAGVAPNNVTPGYYYWDGVQWVRLAGSNDAWLLTGNAGTNPATNFIGTTDAQPWVIKTGGSAAVNERIRVLAPGQTVVNNTGLGTNTNDVFSVYANGTTNGATPNTAVLGTRAINGYTSTGFGLSGWTSGTTATTFGVFGSATAATGTANAIRGEATSVNGLAIVGLANTSGAAIPTTTNARGVVGQVNGTLAGTALAIGVQGIINTTITTGDARGVQGATSSDAGIGVIGFANTAATTNFAYGVLGQAASASSTGVLGNALSTYVGPLFNPTGVLAVSASSVGFGADAFNVNVSGTGLLAEGNNLAGTYLIAGGGGAFTGAGNGLYANATTVASGTGVIGVGNNAGIGTLAAGSGGAFSGATTGSYSRANTAATGTGVIGIGNNIAAPTVFPSGSGGAFNGTTAGAYALATTVASGTGIVGVGNNAAFATIGAGSGGAFTGSSMGSFAKATGAAGTGSLGVGNNVGPPYSVLVAGSGAAGHGQLFGVYGVANSNLDGVAGTPARAGGYFESGTGATNAYTYVAAYEGAGVPRKVMGNGTVNTVVRNDAGEYVLLSAPEAPENLFQDYGTGELVNGRAHIDLDPTLARNILVNEEHPLRVFIQLRGDCKGVYVTNESGTGFDVVELQGGTSSVAFNWTVVANRANQVFEDGTAWNFAEERFAHTEGPQAHATLAGNSAQAGITLGTASPERATRALRPEERARQVAPRPAVDEAVKPGN